MDAIEYTYTGRPGYRRYRTYNQRRAATTIQRRVRARQEAAYQRRRLRRAYNYAGNQDARFRREFNAFTHFCTQRYGNRAGLQWAMAARTPGHPDHEAAGDMFQMFRWNIRRNLNQLIRRRRANQ